MAEKLDLNKLRNEIHNRKQAKNSASSQLNEETGVGVAPRDTFLNGLLESLNTGRETASTALVKTVENATVDKKGGIGKMKINEHNNVVNTPSSRPQPQSNTYVESGERDEQLFAEFEKRRNQTLADSIESYTKIPRVGAPMNNNANNYPPNNGVQPMMLNEGHLVESVKKVVDGYLVESFGPIVEEAIQSTIIEMYAIERIKKVLHENRELIRSVVIETIRDIQNKNKQNKK